MAEVPHVFPELDEEKDSIVVSHDLAGPALLITHDCALDKRNSAGKPTIERLQFIPLLALAVQDRNRQALLRREAIAPAEAIYVGEVPRVGEAYGLLSALFPLPAKFFQPKLILFSDHPEADPQEPHLTLTKHEQRLGRLESSRLALLRQKIRAFWLREIAPGN